MLANGNIELNNYWAVLPQLPWTFATVRAQHGRGQCGASWDGPDFNFYVLGRRHEEYGRLFLTGRRHSRVLASLWMLFPDCHFSSDSVVGQSSAGLARRHGRPLPREHQASE